MIVVRYNAKGVRKGFWHRLYGYEKGPYAYPGLLSRLENARRLSDSTILVEDEHVAVLEEFLKAWGVPYEKISVGKPPKPAKKARKPEFEPMRWDMPIEILDERLKDFWKEIDALGGFIRTKSVRDAIEDTERFGY